MANEFTVIIEDGGDGWLWAHSPEVPGANGQGRTVEEAKASLTEGIRLLLEYLREKAEAEMPPGSIKDVVRVA